jgi:hypothetical protein
MHYPPNNPPMLVSPIDSASPKPARLWRERLWLPGVALDGRDRDEQARLWLLLDDGRLLVFRLARAAPDDAFLDALAAAVADDARGDTLEVNLDAPTRATFLVLYGAPASPLFCVDPAHPLFGDAIAFNARQDSAALAALARLVGSNTFWASARNYNRLAAHARREERLQALLRFPLLVAPILLTRQRRPNLFDPKRYRWRAHDATVVEAIEQGRDLTGALAACYGISRGLARSPFCATPWVAFTGRPLAEFLQFIDAMPANRRPHSGAEVDVFGSHLPALWALFGTDSLAAASAFRTGYGCVWEKLERRFDPLNESLMDANDYLRALTRWLLANHRQRIDAGRLAALWVGARGLASLLAASREWHARQPGRNPDTNLHLPATVPAILGEWHEGEVRHARELATYKGLAEEGLGMGHCVADYWDDCVLCASRIFALESVIDGHQGAAENSERATALFEDEAIGDLPRYRLAQLRGPRNVPVSEAMQGFARRLTRELNLPERAERRALARQAAKDAEKKPNQPPVVELDEDSIVILTALLALPPIPDKAAGPGNAVPADRLCAPVAGYAHAFDPAREARFAVGQSLTLVREPDNPHDPQAIRIDWQGEKIGYVPRPDNATCAQRLDAGETLSARISEFSPQAPPWKRLWFEIAVS